MTARELAKAFRNGQLRLVTDDILCDGPRAIELAVLLTPPELLRLSQVVNAHANGRAGLLVSGEARGGPVHF